jgi:hypothetical protein
MEVKKLVDAQPQIAKTKSGSAKGKGKSEDSSAKGKGKGEGKDRGKEQSRGKGQVFTSPALAGRSGETGQVKQETSEQAGTGRVFKSPGYLKAELKRQGGSASSRGYADNSAGDEPQERRRHRSRTPRRLKSPTRPPVEEISKTPPPTERKWYFITIGLDGLCMEEDETGHRTWEHFREEIDGGERVRDYDHQNESDKEAIRAAARDMVGVSEDDNYVVQVFDCTKVRVEGYTREMQAHWGTDPRQVELFWDQYEDWFRAMFRQWARTLRNSLFRDTPGEIVVVLDYPGIWHSPAAMAVFRAAWTYWSGKHLSSEMFFMENSDMATENRVCDPSNCAECNSQVNIDRRIRTGIEIARAWSEECAAAGVPDTFARIMDQATRD